MTWPMTQYKRSKERLQALTRPDPRTQTRSGADGCHAAPDHAWPDVDASPMVDSSAFSRTDELTGTEDSVWGGVGRIVWPWWASDPCDG